MTTQKEAVTPKEKAPKEETAAKESKSDSKVVGSRADQLARLAKAKSFIEKTMGQKALSKDTIYTPVSTGSLAVDNLIGGSARSDGKPICLGFPRRHITEIYGPESSGKTTLLLSAVAKVQRAGGVVMFIDFENSLDLHYAGQIGVNTGDPSFAFFQPNNMEEGLKMIYVGIAAGVDLICVDSVAAMVPKLELEKPLDDAAKIGAVAAKLAGVLPKLALWLRQGPWEGAGENRKSVKGHSGTALVFTNQIRALISTSGHSGGESENTSGGKALKFFAYLRLRTSRIRSEFIERKDNMTGKKVRKAYGNLTDVKCVKNKMDGKQSHSTQIFIRYGFGIDDCLSIIEAAVVQGLVKKEGAYYSLGNERHQGKDKFRQFLLSNPKVVEALRVKIAESVLEQAKPLTDDELNDDDAIFEGDADDDSVEAEISEEALNTIADEVSSAS